MNYLIINGSPHKGNTWKLVGAVKNNLYKNDTKTEFEEIHLAELNLPFCKGCSNCFRLGHEKCPHYKIIRQIITSIENADGVIISSTTYNMRETALLKNLFDHLCFMMHRPYFFKSKALILTTAGGVGGKPAAKSISGTLKAIGFNKCYIFSCASFSWNSYNTSDKTKLALNKITDKFICDVKSKKLHSPSCMLLIPYNLFRGMSLSYIKGTEFETEDGVYWTKEERKNKVYDSSVKVPFYKKPIGHIFYFLGKTMGKKTIVTYKKS